MDTRCWVCVAIVKAFKLDPDEGAFADVMLMPSMEEETVRVGSFYAGPGFGFYAPLEKDDEVVVSFPNGNPDAGGVIVGRLWSRSDQPAATAKDHDADVCLHVKEGTNLRVQTFGAGNLVLGSEDGKVLLGEETGTKPVCLDQDESDAGMLLFTPNVPPGGAASLAYIPPPGPYPPPTPPIVQLALKAIIDATAMKVEAK
jgi:hypothetical protein